MPKAIALFTMIIVGGSLNNLLLGQSSNPWPEWVFHHWVWEDESTQESAMQLVDDYIAHDIPVGAIIIDSPWETGYNTFDWDTGLYADPQSMINYFHSKNVRVLIWITTAINIDVHDLWSYGDSMGYFMKQSAGSNGSAVVNWWKGDGSMIDFFNPAAVAWWKSMMDKALDMGIDGWKCDGTDYSIVLGATYSPGAGRTVSRSEYSAAYYQLFHDYTRQRLGNDRVNMSRPIDNYGLGIGGDIVAFTPKDIGWACWVGDQDATFDGLKAALNNMYHSDDYGYLIFGSDIGGYREEPVPNGREKDVFIRWAQLGAFSPLMENGGGGEHRPWMFDQETNDIYCQFVRLHHALIPYFVEQSDSMFNAGESLMQFFNSSNYSFMLGSDIFVAPILSASNNISVNFPSGSTSWVYLFDTTQVHQSGTSASLTIPLGEYPVFLKTTSNLISVLDSALHGTTTSSGSLAASNTSVLVFPNPVSGSLNISGLQFDRIKEYEFQLFDVLGRKVLRTNLNPGNMSVLVDGLNRGVYCYSIYESSSALSQTGKVIVE